MLSGHASHGGNPGKFEPCRKFEVGFHDTFLVHPGTKTAARLHGESYTEVRIFISGQLTFNSVSRTELKAVPG